MVVSIGHRHAAPNPAATAKIPPAPRPPGAMAGEHIHQQVAGHHAASHASRGAERRAEEARAADTLEHARLHVGWVLRRIGAARGCIDGAAGGHIGGWPWFQGDCCCCCGGGGGCPGPRRTTRPGTPAIVPAAAAAPIAASAAFAACACSNSACMRCMRLAASGEGRLLHNGHLRDAVARLRMATRTGLR